MQTHIDYVRTIGQYDVSAAVSFHQIDNASEQKEMYCILRKHHEYIVCRICVCGLYAFDWNGKTPLKKDSLVYFQSCPITFVMPLIITYFVGSFSLVRIDIANPYSRFDSPIPIHSFYLSLHLSISFSSTHIRTLCYYYHCYSFMNTIHYVDEDRTETIVRAEHEFHVQIFGDKCAIVVFRISSVEESSIHSFDKWRKECSLPRFLFYACMSALEPMLKCETERNGPPIYMMRICFGTTYV